MTSMNRLKVRKTIADRCELIFEAWTRAEFLREWFSPAECRIADFAANPTVGGDYRVTMVCPLRNKNEAISAMGSYLEIVPNQKLVFTHGWEGPNRVETLVTVEFKDRGNRTEVILTQEGFVDPIEAKSHEEGWISTLENLSRLFSSSYAAYTWDMDLPLLSRRAS